MKARFEKLGMDESALHDVAVLGMWHALEGDGLDVECPRCMERFRLRHDQTSCPRCGAALDLPPRP